MSRRFTKLLVANRGEIAVRVLRSARAAGYQTVAVYSEVDAGALHVQEADQAVCIGPAPASQSYLDIEAVLAAARATGAQAIHPGYGFLSENPDFARACEAAGVVFIGPSADSVELMGNKAQARQRMQQAGIECVPGFDERGASDEQLIKAAADIGYPLMVKAAAGGGGRGMVLVLALADLENALRSARAIALSSFGSDELILERAVIRPRHVEVQIFADEHGNVVHLGERDCSVQRRHQKVVEEAPCPVMTPALRAQMGQCAVDIAQKIEYRGAGTVEFLLDEEQRFYFLEMNTRLQVEHPVTEMITGLDLVALQLRVAQGETLGLAQEDVKLNGHAVEVRLYAEDPARNFLPRTGVIEHWLPSSKIRVDTGVTSGQEVTPFYDSMLAKFIAWGESREAATGALIAGLKDSLIAGVDTNRDFLLSILESPMFLEGSDITTAFLEDCFGVDGFTQDPPRALELAVAGTLAYSLSRENAVQRSVAVAPALLNWGSAGSLSSRFRFEVADVLVRACGDNTYRVEVAGEEVLLELAIESEGRALLQHEGEHQALRFAQAKSGTLPGVAALFLNLGSRSFCFQDELSQPPAREAVVGAGMIRAPIPGVVEEILVSVGDTVLTGQRVLVLEAMKMQHEVCADRDGKVTALNIASGAQVAVNDLLLEID